MDAFITAAALKQSPDSLVIDVRRDERWRASPYVIRGALRRDPQALDAWKALLPRAASVVVYCVHGHEVSQNVAKALGARFLEGGIEAWQEQNGNLSQKPKDGPTRWVTRERPKIDRIACPWLIRRFIDADAQFLYVPAGEVKRISREREAIAYDVPDAEFGHEGERCSFDAFLRRYRLEQDPALRKLALIVRAADTGRLDLAPQAAGLLAISLGLSRLHADDHAMLEHGMAVYDALYASCK
jgi:rhodanese-related sulfurtransferase